MKYSDMMVDIETLGNGPRAAVIQIGLCPFNLETGEIGPRMAYLVSPDLRRFEADASTIAWWMQQNEAARLHVARCIDEGVSSAQALAHLNAHFAQHVDYDTVRVWALPPQFDLVILENVAREYGYPVPWKYNATRCLRTLETLSGATKEDRVKPEVEHDAGHDAQAQAMSAVALYARIRK